MLKGRLPKGTEAQNLLLTYASILILLALISSIGLDYVNWKRGEKSYLFRGVTEEREALLSEENPEMIVQNSLSSYKISSESIHQYRDQEGILHFMINLPIEVFSQISTSLENEFKKVEASIIKREEQKSEEQDYYLWHVQGRRKQTLMILFACQKPLIAKKEEPIREPAKNKVVIIVDDMGYSLKAIRDICSINLPLTVSILPYTPLAKETARIAQQNSLEVMLHLPMESINSQDENNDIEGIIHSNMTEEEIKETVAASLEQVPFISGVNNHMGSKITANEIPMRIILSHLKENNLFFVDSRTTGNSIAFSLAQKMEIPSISRHVFLDTYNDEDYIKNKLLELFRLAQKTGKAVGICHPSEETLKVLKENFHLVSEYNLEPVFVSQIIEK
ncbi:MAG: divergent polysaccharide deacetylase family protein [Candidatus Aminicenantes bacterium]|nr:MAG: divergent polysaccharide deacetylase family protein [Candidatus Aminicenantes bacterium]